MSSDCLLPELPESDDQIYDIYLQDTLGKCLPPILTDLLVIEPRDPIEWLALSLRRSVENQLYFFDQLNYQEWLGDLSCKEIHCQKRSLAYYKYLNDTPILLENIYSNERRQEQKLSKWIIEHQELIYRQKHQQLLDQLSREEAASSQVSDLLHDISHGALRDTVDQAEGRLGAINKEIMYELTEADRASSSVLNPETFSSMRHRFNTAHLRGKPQRKPSLLSKNTRLSKVTSTQVSSDSSDSSITVWSAESGSSDDNSDSSSFFNKLKRRFIRSSVHPSSQNRVLDLPIPKPRKKPLNFDGMLAARQISEAMNRGQFRKTDAGYKVRHIPGWKKIGQKPRVRTSKPLRCQYRALLPSTWEEDEFHPKVLYDPELYQDPDVTIVYIKKGGNKIKKKSPQKSPQQKTSNLLSMEYVNKLTPDDFASDITSTSFSAAIKDATSRTSRTTSKTSNLDKRLFSPRASKSSSKTSILDKYHVSTSPKHDAIPESPKSFRRKSIRRQSSLLPVGKTTRRGTIRSQKSNQSTLEDGSHEREIGLPGLPGISSEPSSRQTVSRDGSERKKVSLPGISPRSSATMTGSRRESDDRKVGLPRISRGSSSRQSKEKKESRSQIRQSRGSLDLTESTVSHLRSIVNSEQNRDTDDDLDP